MSSFPLNKVHVVDFSPRPSTPNTPSTPSSSYSPSSPPRGTMSPSAGTFLDPQLLVNKSPNELPQGVDPSQREVGAAVLQVGVDGQ